MEFRKYQHIERFGEDEVIGINHGECYIFPKIDGTNGSVWQEAGEICVGGRNRQLSYDDDNRGFYKYITENEEIKRLLIKYPNYRLYGEWLVPHDIKKYQDDAWSKFYVFEVAYENDDGLLRYLHYEEYKQILDSFEIKYIPPICKITDPTHEDLLQLLEKNTFLIKDGEGVGEGIVIKNYGYLSKYGRKTWAKIVLNEFIEKHSRKNKRKNITAEVSVEQMIVDQFCTEAFINKEYAKIVTENDGWKNAYIGMLFGKVFHELIIEETWNMLKKFKNPTINYRILNKLVIDKIRVVKKELF